MASINLGNGNHDLGGDYRLVPDGGEWFIMGHNLSIPGGTYAQAKEIFDMLQAKDSFKKDGAAEPKLFSF